MGVGGPAGLRLLAATGDCDSALLRPVSEGEADSTLLLPGEALRGNREEGEAPRGVTTVLVLPPTGEGFAGVDTCRNIAA